MKKYLTALIIGLLIFVTGSVVVLFEVISYDTGITYDKYNSIREYTYQLDRDYTILNNGKVDDINIIYDNDLVGEMSIDVTYNDKIIKLNTYMGEEDEKTIINIYSKNKNNSSALQHFYNLIKDSIEEKTIYDYSDSYTIELDIYINESEVERIVNYASIEKNNS